MLRKLKCLLGFHAFTLTERRAIILFEVQCSYCKRCYVGNVEDPGVFLPADKDFNKLLDDFKKMEDIYSFMKHL